LRYIAFALLLACGLQVQGQEQEGTGVIKTNPLGWFAGQFQFGYEHFLSEKLSVQVLPGVIFSKTTVSDSASFILDTYDATRLGFIVVPELRYYLGDVAPDGLYIAPFARFRAVRTTIDSDPDVKRVRGAIGGGFVLGYQYQLANGLTGELFIGPQYKSTSSETEGGFDRYEDLSLPENEGMGVRFGANIGIGW